MSEVLGSSVAGAEARPAAGLQDLAPLEKIIRRLSPIQRKFVKAGCFHGDFTMATVHALRGKRLFHLVIDSPNGRCGFMRLTPLGEKVQAALSSEERRGSPSEASASALSTDEPNTSPQKDITHDH